mmetsp:Transcript_20194/g.45923  ORF Transcript_20194/g.45923 Transcript_20194/m.45923 type:complete len:223 (-) Transcript_20194:27-695(-)
MIALICAAVGYTISLNIPPVPPDRALKWGEKLAVMKQVGVYAWSQIVINATTMAVFPGMATNIEESTLGLTRGWLTVVVVSIYAATDTLGNATGAPISRRIRKRSKGLGYSVMDDGMPTLLGMSYFRVAFIPLFLIFGSNAVQSDIVLFISTAALGYSNGALSVVCMTYAPQACSSVNPEVGSVREREHAGYIMVVALLLGVSVGATVAIPLNLIASEFKGQ